MSDTIVKHGIRSVVVGVDFSPPSVSAVNWVRRHLAPGATCTLVHAIEVPKAPRFLQGNLPSRDEVVARESTTRTEELRKLAEEHGWGDVRIEIRDGRPENVIAEVAQAASAEIVVVGEHVRSRRILSTLGSTAEALVRSSPVPVVLARSTPDGAPTHLLVALDDSDEAQGALRIARALAQTWDAHVTVYHGFRPVYLNIAESVSGLEAGRRLRQDQYDQAHAWVESQVRAVGLGAEDATIRVQQDDPATGILSAQRGSDVDLIVMGSSGAGGAGRLLLGSVADGVLRGATCPVLVVR